MAETDGITEAEDAAEQQYTLDRVAETVKLHLGSSARELVETLFADVAEFSRGGTHEDDKFLVVMKVL